MVSVAPLNSDLFAWQLGGKFMCKSCMRSLEGLDVFMSNDCSYCSTACLNLQKPLTLWDDSPTRQGSNSSVQLPEKIVHVHSVFGCLKCQCHFAARTLHIGQRIWHALQCT